MRPFTSIILYRDYRLVWMGSWTEHMGEWMEVTALLWLMNQMTHSPFMGTLMITLRYLPLVFFAYIPFICHISDCYRWDQHNVYGFK